MLDGASAAAAAALPAADCAACCDGAAHGEAAQFFSPGAELASHVVHHNWCVTTRRSARFMRHVCALSQWLCSEVSSVHSRAVPSHAMDPANAFAFHGAVGDGRALFGSTLETDQTVEQTQCLLPDPELASHLGRHKSCVTMTPQTAARNDGLRAWLRDKAGVAVRFLDDVVEVLTAEQVDGPEDLAFFATTPAFDAKLTATTAARIRAVLATEAAPSVAATCAPVDQEATQLLTRCTHSLHESDGGKAASSVAPELAAGTALAIATPPVLCVQAPSAAIAPAGGPSPGEIVYLSVGGTPFTTRRSTLCRVPDSALAKLFTLNNGFREPDKDKSGAYFLNRNAKFFTWVHDYLLFECRLYDLPPPDMIRSVRMEADFWGLKNLVDILEASLAQPCLGDQRVEAVRFVNDGPDLSRLLDEDETISNAVRRAIAAVYIRASEDEFGQPIFVADGFSNLVLHNIFDETASSWLVCDSVAKTQDNFDRSLLRCLESSADAEFDAAYFGVWMVRVCTSEEQHRFREVPELALRSVPRSIALSLEVPVGTDDVE